LTLIAIEEALVSIPGNVIPSVTVSDLTTTATNFQFKVTFSDPVNSGPQNVLVIDIADHSAAGNQPISSGITCGDSNPATVVVDNTSIPGTPYSHICSGRGNCDEETGICVCHKGFNGLACNLQNTIA
jgi:hypothetical protein